MKSIHTIKFMGIMFLFLFSLENATAQAPGYLGKKFIIGTEATFTYSRLNDWFAGTTNRNIHYRDPNPPSTPVFIFKFGVLPEFVLSRRLSLVGIYHFSSSLIETSGFRPTGNPFGQVVPNAPTRMTTNSFGGAIRLYSKNTLAPLGPYHQFAFEAPISSLKTDGIFEEGTAPEVTTATDFFLSYTLGKQTPLNDHLLLHFNGCLYIPLSTYYRGNGSGSAITENNWAESNADHAITKIYGFSVAIGISFLP